jgi:hypothetical protein
MIDVLGVAMGIDLQGFAREEGSDELPPGVSKVSDPGPHSPTASSSPPPTRTPPPKSTPSAPPAPAASEDVEMDETDSEEAAAKKEAEAAKKAGNDAYKARDFQKAAEYFTKAWDVWPKDITFLTNLGGAAFSLDDRAISLIK